MPSSFLDASRRRLVDHDSRRPGEAPGRLRLPVSASIACGDAYKLVFAAVGRGRAAIVLAETRGETAKAYRAVRYEVTVV